MSTPSLGTIAEESVGWSIALSVLMILTGVLAIMIQLVAGIVVLVVVAWLLMFSGAAHLVFAWHDLEKLAVEQRMGDRHPGGDQHAFQRCRPFITVSCRPPGGCQVVLNR